MSLEKELLRGFDYKHCILFPRARAAIALFNFYILGEMPIFIPSNVCPALLSAIGANARITPIEYNGLAEPCGAVHVQLYGARQHLSSVVLEIDPCLTGWMTYPQTESAIISFGYSKPIDLGRGGALLTNSDAIFDTLRRFGTKWSDDLRARAIAELQDLRENINRRREKLGWWMENLRGSGHQVQILQVTPWRAIWRFPENMRDAIAAALRIEGIDAGTNYPPLPGVTDREAVQFGKEVLNLWVTDDYDYERIKFASEIIKRTIGQ
jgi:hypothetical protein